MGELKPEKKKIQFAPHFQMAQYQDIAEVFFKKVFDLNYREMFVSDESRLQDFFGYGEDTGREHARVLKIIEDEWCDVSDIKDGLIVNILERLRVFFL